MSVSARASEPSMEEILASIRRIISDEVAEPATAPASTNRPPAASTASPPRPVSASARSIPAREMTVRETSDRAPLAREASARPAPPLSPRELIPTRPQARPAYGPPTGSPATPDRPAPAPLRARPVETFVPMPSVVSRPVAVAGSADLAPCYGAAAPALRAVPAPAYVPVGRPPALDPFAPRSHALAVAALPAEPEPDDAGEDIVPVRPDVSVAAPSREDPLDTPLESVLLDLALVEQAVKAELANVALDASARPRDLPTSAGRAEQRRPTESIVEAKPEAETADMQLQARTKQDDGEHDGDGIEAEPVHTEKMEAAGAAPVKPADAAQAGSRPAPTLPRAFVPTFRAEPRLGEATRPGGQRPAAEATGPGEPPRERLVSTPANNAVTAAFGSLHRSVTPPARTVDDLVTDALRPMLKSWLDENLPTIVERLVKAEIERVSREGR